MATTTRTPAPSVPKEMVNSGAMETVCGKGQVRNPLKIENNMFKKNYFQDINIFRIEIVSSETPIQEQVQDLYSRKRVD